MGFRLLRAAIRASKFANQAEICIIRSEVERQSCFWISRRWHTGDHSHSHSHHHHHLGGKEGDKVFKLGLAADVALAGGKGVAGFLSGSTAVIADAAHSITDIVLSGVALWSFRASRVPKDKVHPYGHGKFESLGALGISCMLLGTSGGIAWHALHVFQDIYVSTTDATNHIHIHSGHHHGIDLDHPFLALSVTILSILVKEGLYWITKRAGDKERSELMKANAWHHRADAVSSVVALVGIGSAILGMPLIDPLAGLVVSGMILKAGLKSGYNSLMELLDAGVPRYILSPIKETIRLAEGVKGCHRLRGRKAGSSLYLDVHIEVDPFLSVSAAHNIGEKVRHKIQQLHEEVAEVFIHIDPSVSGLPELNSDEQNNSKDYNERDIDTLVRDIFPSQFPKMMVEHITWHSLQGKIFLQILVSMAPDTIIKEAMEMAKRAENEVLRADPTLGQVSIHLKLSQLTP
ncbi:cation efflux family protein [Wolffia australiana]